MIEHLTDSERAIEKIASLASSVPAPLVRELLESLSLARAELVQVANVRDVMELAEDLTRSQLEADGPCPDCHGGDCLECSPLEDPDCRVCDGEGVVPHEIDCRVTLLYGKARAALGKA